MRLCTLSVQPATCGATRVPVGWLRPRMVTRWSESLSIAWYSALRTRKSLSGFLPLMFDPGNSSRCWSIPKKMVRLSTPSITLRLALLRKRGKSCGLGSSMKSISPESMAATRVASDLIGV